MKPLKFLSVFLLSLVMILPISARAENLISIIIADTKDESIGESVKSDLEDMRNKMQEIANFTQMKPIAITLRGNRTTPENVLKRLNSLKVEEGDVVVFFYAGHGYHLDSEKNSTPWPNLYFSRTNEGLQYTRVMEDLEKKKPRLLIMIVDICNSLARNGYPLARGNFALADATTPDYILEHNYRQLFLETQGTIKVASASTGEFAWGGPNGGVFTQAFISKLNSALESTYGIDWKAILDSSSDQTSLETSQHGAPQHPYYEVELSQYNREEKEKTREGKNCSNCAVQKKKKPRLQGGAGLTHLTLKESFR